MHAHTRMHTHLHKTNKYIHTNTYIYKHIHAQTYTHTNTYTNTNTDEHIHTCVCKVICPETGEQDMYDDNGHVVRKEDISSDVITINCLVQKFMFIHRKYCHYLLKLLQHIINYIFQKLNVDCL